MMSRFLPSAFFIPAFYISIPLVALHVTSDDIFTTKVFAAEANESKPLIDDSNARVNEHIASIKSLSKHRIEGLLSGKGLGLAKAAELNGYPGPKHVLELKKMLNLTSKQRNQSQALFHRMQSQAQKLGAKIITEEAELNRLFSSTEVNQKSLMITLDSIALLESQLKAVHLEAHIKQAHLLTPEQIETYYQHRGIHEPKYMSNPQHHVH